MNRHGDAQIELIKVKGESGSCLSINRCFVSTDLDLFVIRSNEMTLEDGGPYKKVSQPQL